MSISQPGEYKFLECKIESSSGIVFPIAERIIVSMNFYEEIFSNAINGMVEIVDTANLPTNMPITGQDFFILKLATNTLEEEPIIDHVFIINQILGRQDLSTGAQGYVLSLVSPESLRSNRTRVSATYTDTVSNVVKNIMRDKQLISSNKDLILEKTSGLRKFVAPNLRPFDFIRNLTKEAVSSVSTGSPHYLFYETTQGFNFVTLDYLYNKPTVADYETSDKVMIENNSKIDVEHDLGNILGLSINNTQDTLMASRGGMLSSKLTVYNIFQKNYKVYTHNYFRDFNKFGRIDENPIYNDTEIDEQGNTIADFPNASINLHPTSNDNGLDVRYDGSFTDNQSENWLLSTKAKIMELSAGQSVQLEVHGRTGLAAGDKVNLSLPVSGKTSNGEEFDKVYEGEFLVTTLRHMFSMSPNIHMIAMVVCKDSIPIAHQKIAKSIEPKKDGIDIEV